MSFRMVTDSTADVLSDIPGEKEFCWRLDWDGAFPTTVIALPVDSADVGNCLVEETDEIISIHLNSRESGVKSSALLARAAQSCQRGTRFGVLGPNHA